MLPAVLTKIWRLLARNPTRFLPLIGISILVYTPLIGLAQWADNNPIWLFTTIALLFPMFAVSGIMMMRDEELDAQTALQHSVRRWHRILSQTLTSFAPLMISLLTIKLTSMLHPLLALMAVPIALMLLVLSVTPAMLTQTAVALGSAEWMPLETVRLLRANPLRVALFSAVSCILIPFSLVPIALVGVLFLSTLGSFSAPGYALLLSAPLPLFSAAAFAAWISLGGSNIMVKPERTYTLQREFDTGGSTVASWRADLAPLDHWGVWLDIPPTNEQLLSLECDWSAQTEPPRLLACDAAGNWVEWPALTAPNQLVSLAVRPGPTWLQLISVSEQPQAVSLRLLSSDPALCGSDTSMENQRAA